MKFAGDGVRPEDVHRRDGVHLRPLHVERREGRHRHPRAWTPSSSAGAPSTQVTGLDSVPADDRPPANTMLHWAFDTMVGICTLLMGLGLWLGVSWWRKRDFPQSRWFLRATAVSGLASVVALECGWIVTEVGRQPWIVYKVMRTEDAVTQAERDLGDLRGGDRALRRAGRGARSSRCGRWRGAGARPTTRTTTCPTARTRPPGALGAEARAMSSADAVAVVLLDRRDDVRGLRRRGLRRRLVEPAGGRRRARPAPARAHRLGDRPGLGGQPRLADLRARRALDRLLLRVRGDLLDVVHPAQPRRARHRAARVGVRLPQDGAGARGAGPCPSGSSGWRRCSRRSSWARSWAHRGRPRAGGQRGRRRRHELAQPALARDRGALRRHRRVPLRGVPGQRRAARRRARPRAVLHAPARWAPPSSRARSRSPGWSCCTTTPGSSSTG